MKDWEECYQFLGGFRKQTGNSEKQKGFVKGMRTYEPGIMKAILRKEKVKGKNE